MAKRQTQYRQGDLLFIRTDAAPAGEVRAQREVTLALGEATGHAHRIRSPRARLHVEDVAGAEADAVWSRANRILEVAGARTVELRHEDAARALTGEHGSIRVAPGRYRVIQQVEWDGEQAANVAD